MARGWVFVCGCAFVCVCVCARGGVAARVLGALVTGNRRVCRALVCAHGGVWV